GTEVSRASARSDIFEKGCSYDVASAPVDGQDALAVYRAMREALDYARRHGPYLMEAKTYRYSGHSMGDPERYRSKAEIERWRAHDPIDRLANVLLSHDLADKAALEKIHHDVEQEMEEIVRFAQESPEPADAALFEHVYVNPIPER
ncbi:MAG: thiamine pyrophosphate-dependent enzyme, partial [Anaerolineae bacterium]|nr:thiamine pyrophosphate-dependent enzyme [Anaerolineae bacterium]MDW8072015.1 thiamine pyrophosphate-dependent enzyme [Anaerolineae bacterium]